MDNEAVHFTIVNIDVQGSGRLSNQAKLAMRKCLYAVVDVADKRADVTCARIEDRGDGVLALYPAATPKVRLVGPWLATIDTELRSANAGSSDDPVRVRVGVHAGEVHFDANGMVGADVDFTCRLADAEVAKETLANAGGGCVAVVASDVIYRSVISQGGRFVRPGQYARVAVKQKEVDAVAWLAVLGYSVAPVTPASLAASRRPTEPSPHSGTDERLVVNAENAGIVRDSSVGSLQIGNRYHYGRRRGRTGDGS